MPLLLLTVTSARPHDRPMMPIQLNLTRTTTTTAYGGSRGGCGCLS